MPSPKEKAAEYLKAKHSNIKGLSWDNALRDEYLVSEVITDKAEANRLLQTIRETESQENKAVYRVAPSSTKTGFRIVVDLTQIKMAPPPPKIETDSLLQIADFLNKVHTPLIIRGAEIFKGQWQVKGERIYCVGPSKNYTRDGQLISGWHAETALKNQLSTIARDAGWDPLLADDPLGFKDNRRGCTHWIKPDLIEHLLKLAKQHKSATPAGTPEVLTAEVTAPKVTPLKVTAPEVTLPEVIPLKVVVPEVTALEAERWQQFKQQQERTPTKAVVMSIQTLDREKIALGAEQLEEFAKDRPGLKTHGDGHTGFAIARALHAPFVVVRSTGNREEANKKLMGNLGDNGLIVFTGHGSPGGSRIQGNYVRMDELTQTKREPAELVSSAMEAGLKSGTKVTILLSICYGALDGGTPGTSFAHKLAGEFAKQGISTTIIASDKPVTRFGSKQIDADGSLTFNKNGGMAAHDVRVFTTEVTGPSTTPTINVYSPNESIQLTRGGLKFIDPNKPTLISTAKKGVDQPGVETAPIIQGASQTKVVVHPGVDATAKGASQPKVPSSVDNVKKHYEYAAEKTAKGRFHAFTASTLKEELKQLKGDALKTEILRTFKDQLKECATKDELTTKIKELKKSEEYTILATGQGIMTRLFGLDTSSIKAFNKIANELSQGFDNTSHKP